MKRFDIVLCNRESILANICDNVFKHDVKAGNHETFLGNEGKDVKQQNIFFVNNK